MIEFSNGSPTAASDDRNAAIDVFANADLSRCPDECFRPVGLAFDAQGRLFLSSDATGEVYVITKDARSGGSKPPASTAGNFDSFISILHWVAFTVLYLLY